VEEIIQPVQLRGQKNRGTKNNKGGKGIHLCGGSSRRGSAGRVRARTTTCIRKRVGTHKKKVNEQLRGDECTRVTLGRLAAGGNLCVTLHPRDDIPLQHKKKVGPFPSCKEGQFFAQTTATNPRKTGLRGGGKIGYLATRWKKSDSGGGGRGPGIKG